MNRARDTQSVSQISLQYAFICSTILTFAVLINNFFQARVLAVKSLKNLASCSSVSHVNSLWFYFIKSATRRNDCIPYTKAHMLYRRLDVMHLWIQQFPKLN